MKLENAKIKINFVPYFPANNTTYIESSDENEICQNTKRRLHPGIKIKTKRRRVDSDEEDVETHEDTMKIREQDLDHTLYDEYTKMYCLARKGSVKETADSFTARAVYRNRRFITVVVRNFYHAARRIPYPLLTRGDGVGGIYGRVFLHKQKRIRPDFTDKQLHTPCIDLNELMLWGKKGIIFGDRKDINLDVVPFEVGKGGRIQPTKEDEIVDVEEVEEIQSPMFVHLKMCGVGRHSDYFGCGGHVPKKAEDEGGNGHSEEGESDGDEERGVRSVAHNMEIAIGEWGKARVNAQVNFAIAKLMEENAQCEMEGIRVPHKIDSILRLQLHFEIERSLQIPPRRRPVPPPAPPTPQGSGNESDSGTIIYGEMDDERANVPNRCQRMYLDF